MIEKLLCLLSEQDEYFDAQDTLSLMVNHILSKEDGCLEEDDLERIQAALKVPEKPRQDF